MLATKMSVDLFRTSSVSLFTRSGRICHMGGKFGGEFNLVV